MADGNSVALSRGFPGYSTAFTRALQTEKRKAPLFPGPVGVGVSNDWCIIHSIPYKINNY